MGTRDSTDAARVLLVSGWDDETIADCERRLRECGVDVVRVDDVYSAMSRLAGGEFFAAVLLDPRQRGDRLAQFARVASRYFPTTHTAVPALDDDRRADASAGDRISREPLDTIIDGIRRTRTEPAKSQTAEAADPLPVETAIEDSAPAEERLIEPPGAVEPAEPIDREPCSYEAVRLRMSEGRVGPMRRPPQAPEPHDTNRSHGTVPPAELDALLTEGPETESIPSESQEGPA